LTLNSVEKIDTKMGVVLFEMMKLLHEKHTCRKR